MKQFIDLQVFAEGTEGDVETTETLIDEAEPGKSTEPEKKYTDDEVNEIIKRRKAEWQKQQDKKTSEAERLGKMTAEEKANERMKALEDRVAEYERREAKAEMTKQARNILSDKGITVNDALLANLVAEDAEATKENVENFASMYKAAVEKGIKEAVRGETPRAGGKSTGMTREQILAIPNRAERQRAISENMNLFR